jgi:hypothetical protein
MTVGRIEGYDPGDQGGGGPGDNLRTERDVAPRWAVEQPMLPEPDTEATVPKKARWWAPWRGS